MLSEIGSKSAFLTTKVSMTKKVKLPIILLPKNLIDQIARVKRLVVRNYSNFPQMEFSKVTKKGSMTKKGR